MFIFFHTGDITRKSLFAPMTNVLCETRGDRAGLLGVTRLDLERGALASPGMNPRAWFTPPFRLLFLFFFRFLHIAGDDANRICVEGVDHAPHLDLLY